MKVGWWWEFDDELAPQAGISFFVNLRKLYEIRNYDPLTLQAL